MLTIFRDPLLGLLMLDAAGERLPLFERPPDTTHAEMWQDGFQRLPEAYPGHEIRWYGLEPLAIEDLYTDRMPPTDNGNGPRGCRVVLALAVVAWGLFAVVAWGLLAVVWWLWW